jgi:hypothetical protein
MQVDLREFIELLNSSGVKYLVVGGYAVAYHGYPRLTKDIDILVDSDPSNAERLISAINAFGFESVGLTAADFTVPDRIVLLGYAPNRIDILTSISGVSFEQAWNRRIVDKLEDIPSTIIHRDDLIASKRAAGRPQDLADARKLERRSR